MCRFPGGSKGSVNRAGDRVAAGEAAPDDLAVIDEWRSAHKAVMNTFQASLRNRTCNTEIAVAQRHKRRNTIADKLRRFPGMKLARMDDVAGCRVIFPDLKMLNSFRADFHKARFRHTRRNDLDKYDYIKAPKSTGYRGIHDVYIYDVQSASNAHLKGLLIELQYRTRVQHAWATTVEVIAHISSSQPKFQRGDKRYQQAMVFASEILSRAHEDLPGPLPDYTNEYLVRNFEEIDKQLHLTQALEGLNRTGNIQTTKRNAILIFREAGNLEVETFKTESRALERLFELEVAEPGLDVVLVKADTSEEVRFAYKNYFSDAKDFLGLLRSGKRRLLGRTRRYSGRPVGRP